MSDSPPFVTGSAVRARTPSVIVTNAGPSIPAGACPHAAHCGNFSPTDFKTGACTPLGAQRCPDAAYWRGDLDSDGEPLLDYLRPRTPATGARACRFPGCPGEGGAGPAAGR